MHTIKTEHAGAKHGTGAYWGTRQDAKTISSRIRRRNDRLEIQRQLKEVA